MLAASATVLARQASAQPRSMVVPKPDELYHALKTPANSERVILGVSALRTLLLFEFTRHIKSGDDAVWLKDREEFFKLLGLMRNPEARDIVSKMIERVDPRAVAPEISEIAIPAARRYEDILNKGGVQAGSPQSADLLSAFFNFNRFLVAYSPDNQRWYCRYYPLSAAC